MLKRLVRFYGGAPHLIFANYHLWFRLAFRFHFPALMLLLLSSAAGVQECRAESTSSLLQRAYRLTAQKKFSDAEQAYRELAAQSPADGYPALARFLNLT